MLLRAVSLLALAALAACSPPVPDSGADYDAYLAARDAEVSGTPAPLAVPPAGAAPMNAPTAGATALATETVSSGAIGAPLPAQPGSTSPALGRDAVSYPTGLPDAGATPVVPAQPQDHSTISDENEFSAVSARETIASDKARIEANRAGYVNVAPTALPERSGGSAVPSIVQYALAARNKLGESIYRRSGVSLANSEKACLKYSSPGLAQEAFLKRGGPERDPGNLDPDGDGFACAWDPTPFQVVAQ